MFICPLLTGTNLVTSIAAGLLRVYAWNIKSSATRIKWMELNLHKLGNKPYNYNDLSLDVTIRASNLMGIHGYIMELYNLIGSE